MEYFLRDRHADSLRTIDSEITVLLLGTSLQQYSLNERFGLPSRAYPTQQSSQYSSCFRRRFRGQVGTIFDLRRLLPTVGLESNIGSSRIIPFGSDRPRQCIPERASPQIYLWLTPPSSQLGAVALKVKNGPDVTHSNTFQPPGVASDWDSVGLANTVLLEVP